MFFKTRMASLVFGYTKLKIAVEFLFHHRTLLTTSYVQSSLGTQINKAQSLTLRNSQLSVKRGTCN